MKKIIVLMIVLMVTTHFSFAQQAIAKIKYEEAEEAYANDNFDLTISKLSEVEELLKSTNPRVMYLKIMAQDKIISVSPARHFTLILSTKQLCSKYLKEYENLPENEDKYRDVYKKLETLNAYPEKVEMIKKAKPTISVEESNATKEQAFNIYTTSFNEGLASFNKKDWDAAFKSFSTAVKYSDIIFRHNWSSSTSPFDTTSILYTGYSAQNGKRRNDAVDSYNRLIDNKVSGEKYIDIYKYVLLFYTDNKDSNQFYEILSVYKSFYPRVNWVDYKMNFIRKNNTLSEIVDLYDKDLAAGKMGFDEYMGYGDIFSHIDKGSLEKNLINACKERALDAFEKAIKLKPSNASALFNVGVLYYNRLDAAKKRNDPNFNFMLETASKWLEKSFVILKDNPKRDEEEQAMLSKSASILETLYDIKGDKAKSDYYRGFQ